MSSADSDDLWDETGGTTVSDQFSKENHENRQLRNDPINIIDEVPTSSKTGRGTIGKYVEPVQDGSYLPVNLTGTASPHRKNQYTNNYPPSSPGGPEINSQASMDYSIDTASLLGDGSLVGGQFAGDGSVMTMATNASDNKSLLSCVTRSTVHDMNGSSKSRKSKEPFSEDDNSLSLRASTSSGGGDAIPLDEELFAIGWAKALDPSSGCYYYFTLDRSTTVWENPLNTQDI